ncbi:DUF1302 family protein [Sulfurirhabdus autotrophica]|uniref:Alginate export domain-containing protein n=1 Tax=Sulfurirhabdus autotrophica TaxID=1706046 RepID=A0A4R3XVY5_9PROT|nr:DUF1302 family protein [Sulfurirhabdus autotrophica]TCV82388.1 hypothetical protein EDC63_12122 [Sulfurirhabdus autotrophica]
MEKKGGFNDRRLNQSSWLVGTLLLGLLFAADPATAAGKGKVEAQSMDDLFGDPAPEAKQPAKKPESNVPAGHTQDKSTVAAPATVVPEASALRATENLKQSAPAPLQFTGFYQNDLAYTYADKKHWSRFNNTLDLSTKGRTAGGVAWKLGGRVNYDPIYDLTNYYPSEVRKDQRFEAMVREAYADFSAGDLDFRVGRQHIVWGEMVGLFFADVVSAKDMRQFILPDFDMIRIPQWAARAEYFKGDFHAEGVWIPYMSYDNIGKPGSEFYPLNPPTVAGFQTVIASEKQPTGLNDGAYGARLSYLTGGWDVSGFYYTANDPSAAFSRQIALLPTPTITYEPIHKRIHQVGGTLGKDLGPMLLKAEVIYTKNKLFSTTNAVYADGLVKQDMLDYVVGLEWSFPKETRFNLQLFQRWFPDHDAGIVPHTTESGVSILFSTQALHPKLEPELLLIRSLNRKDWSAQFKVTWKVDGNWRLAAGADIFEGPPTGLFGQYDNKDRVFTEARYSF